mgnify:FL=1
MSATDLTHHLEERNVKPIQVTKLKTKYDTYASFHVEFLEEQFDEVFRAESWPEGSFVSQFYGKLRTEQIYVSSEVNSGASI